MVEKRKKKAFCGEGKDGWRTLVKAAGAGSRRKGRGRNGWKERKSKGRSTSPSNGKGK